jgi:hypothetical protein
LSFFSTSLPLCLLQPMAATQEEILQLAVREAATYGESESRISTFQSAISKLNKFLKAKPAPMPGYPGEWSELKEVELLVVHLYARFVAWMETTPLDGQAGSSLAVGTILEYNRCVLLASKKAIELGYKQSGKALSEECRRFFVVLEKNAGNTWLRAMEDSLRRRAIQARDAAGQMPVLSTSAIAVPADKLPLCFHALYSEGSPAALQRAAYASSVVHSVSRPSEPAGVRWAHWDYNPFYKVYEHFVTMDKTSSSKMAAVFGASPDAPHAALRDQLLAMAFYAATGQYNTSRSDAPSVPLFPELWCRSNNYNTTYAGSIWLVL